MKTRSMSKAERSSLDRISTLPQPILETILSLLPTRLAVRTSILSREWRYKWTTIPKLELDHCAALEFCEQISDIANRKKNIGMRCKHSYNINKILLQHQGPINELTFDLPNQHCSELDKIILHLSRNHPLKKLTLIGWDSHDAYWYELPKYIFSFHRVTHLDLRYVDLKHLPVSNGFGSLVSLFLRYVGISKKALLHLLSNNPSLKRLSLFVEDLHDDCTVNELLECLHAIEHLTTWPLVLEWVVLDSVPKEPPASLTRLKYFCYGDVVCLDGRGLAFLLVLIKCSPNLEKIKIRFTDSDYVEEYAVAWEEYSNVWLEHLNELEINCFENTKPEMEFVKFILARSPKLKRVSIRSAVDQNQESKMLKALLAAPRVSPVLIIVK